MSHLPLWFKGLTSELEKQAEEHLGETPALREKKLTEFRQLIKENKDLNCWDDDVFLLAFLRSKKFELPRAFKVLKNYYKLGVKHRDTFMGKLPSDVRAVIERKALVLLPYRIPPGSHINVLKIGNIDLRESSTHDFTACLRLIAEMLLRCEATPISGSVNIFDFRDITFQHYTQFLTTSYISLGLSVLQDSWPDRVRGIHFVYEPIILKGFYQIFRPVLTAKIKGKIHFHGNDMESLHQHIPRDYLPEELGGTLGPLDSKELLSYFLSQESFIKDINKYGMLENK